MTIDKIMEPVAFKEFIPIVKNDLSELIHVEKPHNYIPSNKFISRTFKVKTQNQGSKKMFYSISSNQ